MVAILLAALAALVLWYMSNRYNFAQLVNLAQQAGFSAGDAQIAAAIALAESSGNPDAYNPETAAGAGEGEGSFGLWQIYLTAHPEFSGMNLYDPASNAQAAYRVFQEQGFSAWSTYNSGAYLVHLDGGNILEV